MENELTTFITLTAITFIPIGVILAFMPYFTRKTENFGVSIPESLYNRSDFQAMRKKYSQIMLITLVMVTVIFAIAITLFTAKTIYILYFIILSLYLIGSFLIYLPFHRKMKQIKQHENWHKDKKQTYVIDMKFREKKLTIPNWLYLVPAIIIVVTFIIPFMMFDTIPNDIPIHTDFEGNVTYKEKSLGIFLIMPLIQFILLIMFIGINFIIKYTKQQVSTENPEKSKIQNTIFRWRWSVFLFAIGTLTILLMTYLQIGFIYQQLLKYDMFIIYSYTAIVLIGSIVLSITTGQGGSRIKVDSHLDDSVIDRDDDEFWKLGQFYFNRNDPSIFVEKRFGIGWTNNWAHPVSWIFIVIILASIITPLFFIF